jgi:hypothetical protein
VVPERGVRTARVFIRKSSATQVPKNFLPAWAKFCFYNSFFNKVLTHKQFVARRVVVMQIFESTRSLYQVLGGVSTPIMGLIGIPRISSAFVRLRMVSQNQNEAPLLSRGNSLGENRQNTTAFHPEFLRFLTATQNFSDSEPFHVNDVVVMMLLTIIERKKFVCLVIMLLREKKMTREKQNGTDMKVIDITHKRHKYFFYPPN